MGKESSLEDGNQVEQKLWRELPFGTDNLILVGDVHGLVDRYWKILMKHKGNSIQIGDMGFKKQHRWHLLTLDSNKHKCVFGNHDDQNFLYSPHSLANWSWNEKDKIMTIRGAFSIDRWHRTEGIDWWADEEMNYAQMGACIDFYIQHKPKIVISHDCPSEVSVAMKPDFVHIKSITRSGLQNMFETHQPDMWIYGHYHSSFDQKIDGTRFICLDELETLVL